MALCYRRRQVSGGQVSTIHRTRGSGLWYDGNASVSEWGSRPNSEVQVLIAFALLHGIEESKEMSR